MSLSPKPPTGTREFFDPDKLRQNVMDAAREAYQAKLGALESNNFTLKVSNVHYPDPHKTFTIAEQKRAILEKRDITVPLRGTIELIDKKTGSVVDKKETVLAHIPYITERNTAIYNGSEYTAVHQQRLKAGVYTRMRDSGEAESHINVESGSGMGARMVLSPEKETFTYRVQNSQIPLYGLLKDVWNVPDADIEKAWGKEIFHKNKEAYKGNEHAKLHDKVFGRFID